MKIISIDPLHPDPASVAEAAETLADGGIVIYPTDTTYGIGVDAANTFAIERLTKMKQREQNKSWYSMIVSSIDQISTYAEVDDQQLAILQNYLPGPYSFLLININPRYCPLSAVMIRVPDYPLTQALADKFQTPYTTTSANLSGDPPAYALNDLERTLLNPEEMTVAPDLILDAGQLPVRPPSTIVNLTQWPPTIIRQGAGEFDPNLF